MTNRPQNTRAFRAAEEIPSDSDIARHRRWIRGGLAVEVLAMLAVFGGIPSSTIAWAAVACLTTFFGGRLAFTLFRRNTAIMFTIAMSIPGIGLVVIAALMLGPGIDESVFRDVVYARVVAIAVMLFIVFASRRIPGRQVPTLSEHES